MHDLDLPVYTVDPLVRKQIHKVMGDAKSGRHTGADRGKIWKCYLGRGLI